MRNCNPIRSSLIGEAGGPANRMIAVSPFLFASASVRVIPCRRREPRQPGGFIGAIEQFFAQVFEHRQVLDPFQGRGAPIGDSRAETAADQP